MKKFGIQSSMLTMFYMHRRYLITKEKVKEASEGKLKDEFEWKDEQLSINDDLEMFLANILNCRRIAKELKPRSEGKRMVEENVYSFFTPKLTEEELKLVEDKNEDHLKTYRYYDGGYNPDVSAEEMKKSDSKSKYVHARCRRLTYSLTLRKKYGIARMALKNCCKLPWRV